MTLIIMGYDRRYSSKKKAEEYGRFDNRADCYKYLNTLKTGCLGDVIRFFVKEVDRDGRNLEGYTRV